MLRVIVPDDEKMVPSLINAELVDGGRPIVKDNMRDKSPGFSGSEFQAKQVGELLALGMSVEHISSVLKISIPLLQFYYAHEFETSEALVNAEVAKTALDMAKSGRNPEMTQFWLKTRAGWTEKSRLELTGADGGPIEIAHVRQSLLRTVEEFEAIEGEATQVREDLPRPFLAKDTSSTEAGA